MTRTSGADPRTRFSAFRNFTNDSKEIFVTDHAEQKSKLEAAVAVLEAQRSILGDEAVEIALKGIRLQLAELEQRGRPSGCLPGEPSSVPQSEGERRQTTLLFFT